MRAHIAAATVVLALGLAGPAIAQTSKPTTATAATQVAPAQRAVIAHYADLAQAMYTDAYGAAQEMQTAIAAFLAAPSAETQWILLETLAALDEVLSRLALPVRQAFLWSQLDGLSHGEIAERLGASITTVKRYIVKAGAQCIVLDSQRP